MVHEPFQPNIQFLGPQYCRSFVVEQVSLFPLGEKKRYGALGSSADILRQYCRPAALGHIPTIRLRFPARRCSDRVSTASRSPPQRAISNLQGLPHVISRMFPRKRRRSAIINCSRSNSWKNHGANGGNRLRLADVHDPVRLERSLPEPARSHPQL